MLGELPVVDRQRHLLLDPDGLGSAHQALLGQGAQYVPILAHYRLGQLHRLLEIRIGCGEPNAVR